MVNAGRERMLRDGGFTLVEVLAAIVLASVLAVLAVGGFSKLAKAQEQDGTVRELVSTMRNAQSRAVAEARTYCVQFDAAAGEYRLRRGDSASLVPRCDLQVAGSYRAQGSTLLSDVTFTVVDGLPTVFFTPRQRHQRLAQGHSARYEPRQPHHGGRTDRPCHSELSSESFRSSAGFTLIEVIVAISLVGLVAVAAFHF
jgi:prepilin-type N-terminal cleavage/methylation domain-containing protein